MAQSRKEEITNAATHGVGIVLGAVTLVVLLLRAHARNDIWQMISWPVFGISLIALYSASTLYHATKHPIRKARFHIFDHIAIYILIAGTYTAFLVGVMRGVQGWTLFGVAWAIALIGTLIKLRFTGRFRLVSVACYIGMGWLALFIIDDLYAALPRDSFVLLVAGGVAYSTGTYFYIRGCTIPFFHAIWHGFVLLGSGLHVAALLVI